MEVQRKTPYDAFWLILAVAIGPAEASHGYPGKAAEAVGRLLAIEMGPAPEFEGGTTGYIGRNDPAKAVRDFVSYVYDGAAPPDWLRPYVR